MAVVNHQQKWLYLMEPHTASRAVADYLKKHLGGSEVGHHHIGIPELTNRNRTHIPAKQLQGYRIIATVRNPFDMLITKWKYSGKGGLHGRRAENIARHVGKTVEEVIEDHKDMVVPLPEWVEKGLSHPNLIDPSKGLEATATHVVYYEHLNEDLSKLFGREIELPCNEAHKTDGKEYWATYYEGLHDLVLTLSEKWANYLVKYGYHINTDDFVEYFVEIDEKIRENRVKSLISG